MTIVLYRSAVLNDKNTHDSLIESNNFDFKNIKSKKIIKCHKEHKIFIISFIFVINVMIK
jgi:hypothetical protein